MPRTASKLNQCEIPELACGVYRHYKGGFYLVIGVGQHTETDELYVIYVALTGAHLPGPRLRIRPLHLFTDHVAVKTGGVPRYEYVGYEVAAS